jgi:hypothetical protein
VAAAGFVPEILRRGGFQVSPRRSSVPAIFDCTVSDGVRRAALIAVKQPRKENMTLILAPLGAGWRWRALFDRRKFFSTVIACLVRGAPGDAGQGPQGAAVTAPLIPPAPLLVAGAAREMPQPGEA